MLGNATGSGTGGATGTRDIRSVARVDAIEQALVNRLKTRRGELEPLGHPDYGSRHHDLLGEPNVERTRNLIKLYVLQALRHEPRIERVLAVVVSADHIPPRETVRGLNKWVASPPPTSCRWSADCPLAARLS